MGSCTEARGIIDRCTGEVVGFFHLHQMAGCSGSTGVLLFICGADTIECLYCAKRVRFRGVPATEWNDVMSMVSSILKRYIG